MQMPCGDEYGQVDMALDIAWGDIFYSAQAVEAFVGSFLVEISSALDVPDNRLSLVSVTSSISKAAVNSISLDESARDVTRVALQVLPPPRPPGPTKQPQLLEDDDEDDDDELSGLHASGNGTAAGGGVPLLGPGLIAAPLKKSNKNKKDKNKKSKHAKNHRHHAHHLNPKLSGAESLSAVEALEKAAAAAASGAIPPAVSAAIGMNMNGGTTAVSVLAGADGAVVVAPAVTVSEVLADLRRQVATLTSELRTQGSWGRRVLANELHANVSLAIPYPKEQVL
jgi:hypothetical protein